jgi:hypothetical protein
VREILLYVQMYHSEWLFQNDNHPKISVCPKHFRKRSRLRILSFDNWCEINTNRAFKVMRQQKLKYIIWIVENLLRVLILIKVKCSSPVSYSYYSNNNHQCTTDYIISINGVSTGGRVSREFGPSPGPEFKLWYIIRSGCSGLKWNDMFFR